MKDKEKQIEEMAKVLIEASCKGYECENCAFIHTLEEAESTCFCLKNLYNAGYRKIPEGSVVLSKEEWETLHNDYAKALYNARRDERKETAREIFAKEREFIYNKWKAYITMNDLIEFAKQYGVEVEE